MIYRLLYKLLHDSENVRDEVGIRIFAEHAPDGTQGKCIILRLISGNCEYQLQGESDCANRVVQTDCYADSPTAAESLYDRVHNRLSGYRGTLDVLQADGTEVSVGVHEITNIRPGTLIEGPQDSSDRWKDCWSADWNIFHSQTVPTLL